MYFECLIANIIQLTLQRIPSLTNFTAIHIFLEKSGCMTEGPYIDIRGERED